MVAEAKAKINVSFQSQIIVETIQRIVNDWSLLTSLVDYLFNDPGHEIQQHWRCFW